jgi:hypothetical protein
MSFFELSLSTYMKYRCLEAGLALFALSLEFGVTCKFASHFLYSAHQFGAHGRHLATTGASASARALTTTDAGVIVFINVALIPTATPITADALAIGTVVLPTLTNSRDIHVLSVLTTAITSHSRVCVAVFVISS